MLFFVHTLYRPEYGTLRDRVLEPHRNHFDSNLDKVLAAGYLCGDLARLMDLSVKGSHCQVVSWFEHPVDEIRRCQEVAITIASLFVDDMPCYFVRPSSAPHRRAY